MNSEKKRKTADLLTICNKARKTVKGYDSVVEAVKSGKAFCVMTACDASPKTVKEAVFKAVAHATRHGNFDYRIVETGHHADGSPYVEVSPALQKLLAEAGIRQLHISITDEGDYAAAIAVAED